jgi:hypothetical protein
MIVHTKTRDVADWPNAGNYSAHNWKSATVTLADIFLGDSQNKMADAIHNTSDPDLVVAFGAHNRLLTMYRLTDGCADAEIEHHQLIKNLMEDALRIRLRSGRRVN